MLTLEQFKEILKKYKIKQDDFEELEKKSIPELGKIKMVDQYGGEGKGEEYYIVNHFPDHDLYVRLDGYYYSYDGVTFGDDYEIVRPKEKTIIIYEHE